ncbi:MAG: ribonuclease P protein component [Candidatus Paceibacterota bacterium]|jgi:ribonuclease P protein component
MLAKKYRITPSFVFKKTLEKGKRRENQYFKIFFCKNNMDISRFAVIISSKIWKSAVKRNLIKRRIKHIFRELILFLPSGFDILLFVKKDCLDMPFQTLENQLKEFLMANIK